MTARPANGDGKDSKDSAPADVVDVDDENKDAEDEDGAAELEEDEAKAGFWGWKKPPSGNLINKLAKFKVSDTKKRTYQHDAAQTAKQFIGAARDHLVERFPVQENLEAMARLFEPEIWDSEPNCHLLAATEALKKLLPVFKDYIDAKRAKSELPSWLSHYRLIVSNDFQAQRTAVDKGTRSFPQDSCEWTC